MFRAARTACCALALTLVLSSSGRGQEPPPTPQPPSPPEAPPVPLPDQPVVPDRRPLTPVEGVDNGDPFGGGRGRFGGLGGMAESGPNGPAMIALSDRAVWLPNRSVAGQNTTFGFIKESIGLTVPVYRDCANTVAFTAGVGASIFTGDALLPDSNRPFPSTVWNIHFGGSYSHLFSNDWLATIGFSIGSASDKPFENWSQVNLGFHAMLRIPVGERNAWLFSLSYSPLGELGFPVPGVAFQWVPNDWLRMNIGLPFQVTITPTADWQFTASYMLLTNIHTQLSYRVAPRVRLYTGFDWGNEGFHLAEQTDPNERFLYYEMKVNTGVKWTWGQFRFDVFGGYAFDRYFAQGGGPFGSHNRIAVGNTPYLGLSAGYRW